MEKIINALKTDIEYLTGAGDSSRTKLFQLSALNISKKLFSSKEAVIEFNLKKINKEIYIFPEIIEKFKGKPLYAYKMPDESLNEIVGTGDIVLVIFDDKIKPTEKHDGQILAVEFPGGIKALKLFNYPDTFEDRNIDELEDTQESYDIKDIKKILGIAVMVISYKSLLPSAV